MAPHYLLLQKCGVFYFGGDIILSEEIMMEITLEGKQSSKAEKLINYLYKDREFLYNIAHNFQDEQRYTLSLLHDVLRKVDYNTLATLGFRESFLKVLSILYKDDLSDEKYVEKLISENDLVAILIASKIFAEKHQLEYVKMLEERINYDRY